MEWSQHLNLGHVTLTTLTLGGNLSCVGDKAPVPPCVRPCDTDVVSLNNTMYNVYLVGIFRSFKLHVLKDINITATAATATTLMAV